MSQADVVIVGAGVAGAWVARHLSEAGVRVVLLEAGPRLDRAQLVDRYVKSTRRSFMAPFAQSPHAPHPDPERPDDYLVQKGRDRYDAQYVRAVGGTTWHWAGAAWRLLPNDFRLRSLYGVGRDWPLDYAALEPYYARAEREMGVAGAGDYGSPRSGPYPMPAVPLSYLDAYVQRAIAGDGYELVSEPVARNTRLFDNRPVCCGNNNCMPICPIGAQYSGDVDALKAERAGARLIENAVAHFIELGARGKVRAVHYKTPDGANHVAQGRVFVIAANGIETPKLLLASRSAAQPRGLANGSDQVGRNLMDHPGTGVSFVLPEPAYPGRGPVEISSIVNFRDGDFRRHQSAKKLHLANAIDLPGITRDWMAKGAWGDELARGIRHTAERVCALYSFHEQLPDPANRIVPSADLKDALGIARPEITYSIGEYVQRGAADTRLRYERIARRLGASGIKHFPGFFGNNHLMGTTIMGTDPRDSVVDPEGRAHDHDNLFIAGSSVFPSAASVNPTLTLAALSLRLAETIRRDLPNH